MHPDETPRQPEARQPEDFPPASLRPPGMSAGECGDAIWEASAYQGGMVDASPNPPGGEGAQRGVQPGSNETGIRGGRFIDLVERRRQRDQAQ
jgi:hypothetical protein